MEESAKHNRIRKFVVLYCQKEGEVQNEGTVFPLFFVSFCQHLLVVLWEIHDTAEGTSSLDTRL